jgi:carboxymethylenebutenolidase
MKITQDTIQIKTSAGLMGAVLMTPYPENPEKSLGQWPGLVLYSEIFQLTEPILRSAAMMASHGFVVLCPEVYYESLPIHTVLGYDDVGKEKGNRLKAETPMGSFDRCAMHSIAYLKQLNTCTGKVGTMGFCLGGHLAFRAALNSQVSASACFYPTDIHTGTLGKDQPCDTFERMNEIQGEMLMVWGKQDPHIPPEGRAKIYAELTKQDVNFTWHEYNAVHAFMRDEGERYNPSLAKHCYGMAVELFNRVLK